MFRREYGLAQAMEDGYPAACEIEPAQVNLDAAGLTVAEIIARNPATRTPAGRSRPPGSPRRTRRRTTRYRLLLPDRVKAMCWDLFNRLPHADPDRGPLQKTIIFCARDRHADAVAAGMNNLYAHWCNTRGLPRRHPRPRRSSRKTAADTRTPAGLLDLIETKGREIAAAVAELRAQQVRR